MTRALLLSAVALWAVACATNAPPCDSVAFEGPPAHMTNVLREPQIVRHVRGRLTAAALEQWPPAYPVVFELRDARGRIRRIEVEDDGSFDAGVLPEGTYCFRFWGEAFQAYIGTIVVDREADASRQIELTVQLAA